MVKNEKTNKWNSRVMVKYHYVIMVEPGNKYLTHMKPNSGHGKEIARTIHEFLVEKDLTNPLYELVGMESM